MNDNQELMVMGLMSKFDFKNNSNVMDIVEMSTEVLGSERKHYVSAHFYRKVNSELYIHVMLSMSASKNEFKIHSGRCNKAYLGDSAVTILKNIDCGGATMLKSLEKAFTHGNEASPVYSVTQVNPGIRLMSTMHGLANRVINVML